MSRDYKPKSKKASKGNPFLSGLMFGFLLGVLVTAGLTMYIQGDTSPFQPKKEKPTKLDALTENTDTNNESTDEKTEDKLDFYTILPKTESTVSEADMAKVDEAKASNDQYFLQVGSFKNEADADNLKAKLALQGFEAVVQTAAIPEQGTWHRVRVGPLKNIDNINKVRADLINNDFSANLIKVQAN